MAQSSAERDAMLGPLLPERSASVMFAVLLGLEPIERERAAAELERRADEAQAQAAAIAQPGCTYSGPGDAAAAIEGTVSRLRQEAAAARSIAEDLRSWNFDGPGVR